MLWASRPFWPGNKGPEPVGIKDFIFNRERVLSAPAVKPASWKDHFFLMERHAKRMLSSAAFFRFRFSDRHLFNELEKIGRNIEALLETDKNTTPNAMFKVRVLLSTAGRVTAEYMPVNPVTQSPVLVDISPVPAEKATPYPFHKTTHRSVFNLEFKRAVSQALYDTIFVNKKGEITEGAISNIFMDMGDGVLLTPVLDSGLLPGTLRAELLSQGLATEGRITVETLRQAPAIYLGNSVRGLLKARLI